MNVDTPIPALSIHDLRSGYPGGGDIVRGITLDQAPETILAVIGPNGSGKSSFVKTLAGLLRTRTGSIEVTGRAVSDLSPAKRVMSGLAYVPQESNVFRSLTIKENLKLATEFLRGRSGVGPAQEAQVMALFPELGQRPKTLAGNLSGGQRQMLAFACALLANPEVLLLDEPTAGLSPKFVGETMEAVVRVRESGVTVLLVEQNVAAAMRIADEVMVLVAGAKRLLTRPSDISSVDLADLFFGKAQ
jgi:branched-chain amino acid transport system ATP-binding protein